MRRPLAPLVIDLNTAPPHAISALPRLGPTMTRKLVEERTIRPFGSVDDVRRRVTGAGPAMLAGLSPHLRFETNGGGLELLARTEGTPSRLARLGR